MLKTRTHASPVVSCRSNTSPRPSVRPAGARSTAHAPVDDDARNRTCRLFAALVHRTRDRSAHKNDTVRVVGLDDCHHRHSMHVRSTLEVQLPTWTASSVSRPGRRRLQQRDRDEPERGQAADLRSGDSTFRRSAVDDGRKDIMPFHHRLRDVSAQEYYPRSSPRQ
jgi:hypothetical protein